MGHHYVPRQYLRGFCEPANPGWLWEYSKEWQKFRRKSVGAVAQEQEFYTAEVEQQLNQFVETPGNDAIDKLRRGELINFDDRVHLAVYVATMLRRVPHFRKIVTGLIPAVLSETVEKIKKLLSEAVSEGLIDAMVEESRRAHAEVIAEKYKANPPPEMAEQIRSPWPSLEALETVWQMTWRFCSTDGPSFFLTSDNPAFVFDAFKLMHQEAELTFPLSSTLALHGSWRPGNPDGYVPIPQKIVKEFNRRVACGATRYVYYQEEALWIKSVARRHDESSLSRIVWDT